MSNVSTCSCHLHAAGHALSCLSYESTPWDVMISKHSSLNQAGVGIKCAFQAFFAHEQMGEECCKFFITHTTPLLSPADEIGCLQFLIRPEAMRMHRLCHQCHHISNDIGIVLMEFVISPSLKMRKVTIEESEICNQLSHTCWAPFGNKRMGAWMLDSPTKPSNGVAACTAQPTWSQRM